MTAAKTQVAADDRNIYQRMLAVAQDVGVLEPQSAPGGGIAFKYRGVDSTVAHVAPALNKHGVLVVPRVTSSLITEREVGSRVIKTAQVEVEYAFYGPAGDSVIATTAGLADDFADRATAQAMSVAYRIALLQTFHIAAFGKDPEETGQEVLDGAASAPKAPKAVATAKAVTAPATTSISRLQQECKALGRALNMAPDDLNRLGEQISGGKKAEEWFNDAFVMEQLRDNLKARQAGA